MAPSKTKTSFYRRIYVAHLIAGGTNTVPLITQLTGMPRRTAQDTIVALDELDIACRFVGATKDGHYEISDWGGIDPGWISKHVMQIRRVLGY